ncbi:SMI1/KNR4 family protein [Streptomyces niveus]|uniref:SMI1/KNR4 family protein n=1 Tax=Streptomyces niveus TaxID=193462 RepID=UPI00366696DE
MSHVTNALNRLLEIAPAPSEPRQKDWGEVEHILGVELPADYKELIHVYGGSNWDDYLYVLEPGCPNENYDLIEWAEHQAKDLEDLWEFEKKPTELEVEGSRVIPWATTDNGECLYWLVRSGCMSDQWTVMVNEARGDRWEHFSVPCTQFLASALDGQLRSTILSSLFPRATHEFRQLGAV